MEHGMGFFIDIQSLITALTSFLTIGGFAGWVNSRMKRLNNLLDDWNGVPARPGVPRRPGVMERLEKIESKIDKQREENCYERTQRTG
jgi:hypothetical protein